MARSHFKRVAITSLFFCLIFGESSVACTIFYVAKDGVEALSMIEKEAPDLVLLDLMIPRISGGDVLKQMRASDWGKEIRVYIISNLNEEQAPPDLRDLGIEGYTIKSNLRNDDIDALVDKILTPADQEEGISLEG